MLQLVNDRWLPSIQPCKRETRISCDRRLLPRPGPTLNVEEIGMFFESATFDLPVSGHSSTS